MLSVLSLRTERIRLNEHSPCKVCGMFQNKQWISGSVMRFGCHLRRKIHHPHPARPPLNAETRHTGICHPPPLLPHSPHLLAVRSLVTIDLAERSLTLPQHESWQGSQCNAKPSTEKSVLIAVTSQLFFQSSVVILSETIHKFLYVDRLLWRTWQLTWTWLLKCCQPSWDQVCPPAPVQVSITHKDDLWASQSNASPPFKALRVRSSFYRKSL